MSILYDNSNRWTVTLTQFTNPMCPWCWGSVSIIRHLQTVNGDDGEYLMGFGHRVYRTRDPRAAVLEAAARRFYTESDGAGLFETAREFEKVAIDILADHIPDRQLETNVEFDTAILLAGVGVQKELFTASFAISRVAGWMAHAREQLTENRLIRPNARYVGDTGRSWTPITER